MFVDSQGKEIRHVQDVEAEYNDAQENLFAAMVRGAPKNEQLQLYLAYRNASLELDKVNRPEEWKWVD